MYATRYGFQISLSLSIVEDQVTRILIIKNRFTLKYHMDVKGTCLLNRRLCTFWTKRNHNSVSLSNTKDDTLLMAS